MSTSQTQQSGSFAGCCDTPQTPVSFHTYVAAIPQASGPAPANMQEMLVYNRSTRDIIVTYTTTPAGGGTFVVPAGGTYALSLLAVEGVFGTYEITAGAFGTGTYVADQVVIDWKN